MPGTTKTERQEEESRSPEESFATASGFRQAFLAGTLIFWSLSLSGFSQWQRHVIDDSSGGADGIRVADVNQYRRVDLVIGWEEGGEIRVYLHPGREAVRSLWAAVTVARVRSPEDAVFIDLDGVKFDLIRLVDLDEDGDLDVLTCKETDNLGVIWYENPPLNH